MGRLRQVTMLPAMLAIAAWAAATKSDPLEPQPVDTLTYAESYNIVIDTDHGTYIDVQLYVTNLPFGRTHGACRLLLVEDGTAIEDGISLGHRDWRFWRAPEPTLNLGDRCVFSGGPEPRVRAQVAGADVEIRLLAPLAPVRTPLGHIDVGTRFYEQEVLAGWSAAAVLVVRGGKERHLRGFAHADHSRSSVLPADLARGWVRVRALRDSQGVLAMLRYPAEGAPDGWIWRRGDEAPTPLTAVVADEPAAFLLAGAASFQDGGVGLRARFLDRLYRLAPLERYGVLGRLLGRILGNPVTEVFRAEIQAGEADPVAGVVEVSVNR